MLFIGCLETVTPDKLLSVYQGWPHALSCKIFLYTNPHNLLTADQSQKSQVRYADIIVERKGFVEVLLHINNQDIISVENFSEANLFLYFNGVSIFFHLFTNLFFKLLVSRKP